MSGRFRGIGKDKKIILAIGTSEPDPREVEVHTNEHYCVGWGFIGGLNSLKRRRFLRSRSAEGICSYRLWTEPDRGKEYFFVRQFKGRVKVTKEQIEKHYDRKNCADS